VASNKLACMICRRNAKLIYIYVTDTGYVGHMHPAVALP
jgi:hypothetical protein